MKIIELFNRIAMNEKVPKKIIYEHEDYVYNGRYYVCCDHDSTPLFNIYNMSKADFLNDEVEIIEEEKEIEFEDIRELRIPEIDTVENERICRAEYKINALIKNQKKIIDLINDMRDRDENND